MKSKFIKGVEVFTLEPGEKITQNGFWNIDIETHHSQCCDDFSITSGGLRTMELYSPWEFWAFHDLNPDPWPRKPTDALNEGAALAALIEGGMDALLERFVILEGDTPARPTAAQIKAFAKNGKWSEKAEPGAIFWEDMDKSGKIPLRPSQVELLANMAKVLALSPDAQAALDGLPEITMAVFDEETRIWKLSRPDLVNIDGMVNDYKKMSAQGRPFRMATVDRRIEDNGYDMQLGFAAECFEELTGFWPQEAAIIAQSDAAPHPVIVAEILEEDLRFGQFRNRAQLRRVRECLDRMEELKAAGRNINLAWPGPGEHIMAFSRSQKGRERLMERMDLTTVPEPQADDREVDEPITMLG